MTDYIDVLAQMHATLQPKTYLEIGVYRAASLRLAAQGVLAVGVDPEPQVDPEDGDHFVIEQRTSDEFFAGPRPRELFGDRSVDLAFIDGMHLFEYTLRDFLNIEALAGPESTVVIHDCLPPDAVVAARERASLDWCGDVWKLILCLLDRRPELSLSMIDVSPSGLCLVTGLDPASSVLTEEYDDILETYLPLEFDEWQRRLPEVLRRTTGDRALQLWVVRAELEQLGLDAAALEQERDRAKVDLASARSRIVELEASVETLRRQSAAETQRRADAERRVAAAQRDSARLAAEAAQERARLAAVSGSLSWRLTAPVRIVGRALHRSSGAREATAPTPGAPSAVVPDAVEDDASRSERLGDPLLLNAAVEALAYRPLVSILMPVYDTPREYLELALESVLAQIYPDWELCICDDGSSKAETLELLKSYERRDQRIKAQSLERNQGISVASNTALAMAEGEFVAMLDHDDELEPDALLEVVRRLNEDRSLDVVYTDQDYVLADGTFSRPFPKPDWSPELFRGVMYVGHLLTVRRALALETGGFDQAYDNVQDFEFMLRVSEHTDRIAHVPRVTYHWRMIPGSVAFGGDEKTHIERRQAAAVNAHLERCGIPAQAQSSPDHAHRLLLVPKARGDAPRVSVIVSTTSPAENLDAWVQGLLGDTSYPDLEIVVAAGGLPKDAAARLAEAGVIVSPDAEGPTRSRVAGAAAASGSVLVFLNPAVVPVSADWLDHLVLDAEESGVACVAPVVLAVDGSVDSAGLIVGGDDVVTPAFHGWPPESDGHAGSLSCAREVSAVPGVCFAVGKATYDELGGLSPHVASALFQAVDLCFRASSRGLRNLCNPRAQVRLLGADVDFEHDVALDRLLVLDAWESVLRNGDPYWNSGLTTGGDA